MKDNIKVLILINRNSSRNKIPKISKITRVPRCEQIRKEINKLIPDDMHISNPTTIIIFKAFHIIMSSIDNGRDVKIPGIGVFLG